MRGYRIADLPNLIMMQPKTVVQVYMYIILVLNIRACPCFYKLYFY